MFHDFSPSFHASPVQPASCAFFTFGQAQVCYAGYCRLRWAVSQDQRFCGLKSKDGLRMLLHAFAIFLSHSIHAGLRSLERQIRQGMKSCVPSLCREGLHQPHQVCMTNHTCVCNKGVPTVSHKTSYSDPDARIFGSDLRVSINAITIAFEQQKWAKRKLRSQNTRSQTNTEPPAFFHFNTSDLLTEPHLAKDGSVTAQVLHKIGSKFIMCWR